MLNIVHLSKRFFRLFWIKFPPLLYSLANKTSIFLFRSYNINKVAHQAVEEILKIGE